MAGLISSGIGSGLDIASLVQQLVAAEGQPAELRFARKEAGVTAKISAYSSVKGALSDFQTEIDKLKDLSSLLGRTVAFPENEIFTATVESDTPPAEFELDVIQQAVAQKLTTGAFADRSTTVGHGDLTITSAAGSFIVTVDSSAATLVDIQDAINSFQDNTSVRATVVTTDSGAYLSFSSLNTGLANELTITASGGDGGLSALEYDSASASGALSEVRAAADAIIEIDGLRVTSASNEFTNAVEGVTLVLSGEEPGVARNVTIDFDRDAIREKIGAFVDAYNAVVDQFDSQTAFNADADVAGPLLGDTTLRTIRAQLRSEFSTNLAGGTLALQNLRDIGVSIDAEGKLAIDEDRLSAGVTENFLGIGTLFTADDGIAVRLGERVEQLLRSDSSLEIRTEGLQASIDEITEQREALGVRLVSLEARLLRQFNALDSLVAELTNTSNFLSQQLSVLPGSRSNF